MLDRFQKWSIIGNFPMIKVAVVVLLSFTNKRRTLVPLFIPSDLVLRNLFLFLVRSKMIFLFIEGIWFDLRYLSLIGTLISKASLHLAIKISKHHLVRSRTDSKHRIYCCYSSAENCYNLYIE